MKSDMTKIDKMKLILYIFCFLSLPTLIFAETTWVYSSIYESKLGSLPGEYTFAIREEPGSSIFTLLKKDKTISNWSTNCYKKSMKTACLVQSVDKEKKQRNIGIIISSEGIRANLLPITETIYQIDKKPQVYLKDSDLFDQLSQYELLKNLLQGKSLTYKYKERNEPRFNDKQITVDLEGLKENLDFAKDMIKRN